MSSYEIVKALSGKSGVDRRPIIEEVLMQLGIKPTYQNFYRNVNILIPSSKVPFILIGAHYDTWALGDNSVDNASGVAVVCELIKRFNSNPLKNIGIEFCFFDAEETNLLGSRNYMRHIKREDVIGFYNLDMVGFGTNYMLWPSSQDLSQDLAIHFETSAFKYRSNTIRVPNFGQLMTSDHESLIGIPHLTLTTLDDQDLLLFEEYKQAISSLDWLTRFHADKIIKETKLRKVADSASDVLVLINPNTLNLTADIMYDAVQNLDRKY